MRRVIEKSSIGSWVETISRMDSKAKNARLWLRVKGMVSMPRRSRVSVNLNQLDRLAKDGEFLVVPGKVLGFGTLSHKFEIAAVEYSTSAVDKLKESGCEIVGVDGMLKKQNPRLVV